MLTFPEVQFLFALRNGLASIERELQLAAIIGYYAEASTSRHPVLNFAFRHAPGDVITVNVLRLSEALDIHLEHARRELRLASLFTGKGRTRRARDPDLQMLQALRNVRIAHGLRLRQQGEATMTRITEEHGTVIAFLLKVVPKIGALLDELAEHGLFSDERLRSTATLSHKFNDDDMRHLITAANGLIGPAA